MASPIPGYAGYEGWDPVAAQADFKATGGAGKGGPGSGGGVPSISMDDIGGSSLDFAKNNLFPMQDKAFQDYLAKSNSQQKPLDVYNALEERAGIPQMRTTATSLSGQVNDLEDTIRRVEPDVNASTTNSLVTEAQRRGMVTAKKQPLTDNLGWLSQSLGRVMNGIQMAGQDIGNKVNLTMQGQQQELEPYKIQMNNMADRAAMLMTGFNADKQDRLSMLTTKLQRQYQLDDREHNELVELAKEERDFTKQKEMFSYQQQNTPQRQIIDQGAAHSLIDPVSGKVISTYNDVKAPAIANTFDFNGFNDWYTKNFSGGSDWAVKP